MQQRIAIALGTLLALATIRAHADDTGWATTTLTYDGAAIGNSFFYEDRAGIHKVVATSYDSISDTVIAAVAADEVRSAVSVPCTFSSRETRGTFCAAFETNRIAEWIRLVDRHPRDLERFTQQIAIAGDCI